jgi:2,4-dienoyl-CoA reductase-like NADH-dependent reductase (Old Yellow Enzyme family)
MKEVMMPHLFSPLTLRNLTLRNRVMLSPMCMYSAAEDGVVTPWHRMHYAARAVGGVGLIVLEAAAVESRGRISPNDLGVWEDAQIAPLRELVSQVQATGAAVGVQLAHAGRKAWSRQRGSGPEPAVAPSAVPFDKAWEIPHALSEKEIDAVVAAWRDAAQRAARAGFDVIEIHGAHGYLIHEFLSPLANHRGDDYGGDAASRRRFLLRVIDAVREVWPADRPLFLRFSATDWAEGGVTVVDTVATAQAAREHGVDLVDCSSGGMVPVAPPDVGPGFQVPFAAQVRQEADVPTAAVGGITTAELADVIVRNGQADLVALGRELLRHPHWALDAAHTLGHDVAWPKQYRRGRRSP